MIHERELLDSVYEMMGFARWQVEYDEMGRTKSLLFSDAFRALLGYKDETEFPNDMNFYMGLLYEKDQEDHRRQSVQMEADNTKGKNFVTNFRMHKKDGSIVWLHSISRKIFGENGIPKAAIGVVFNITEQKQMEMQEMLVKGMAQEYGLLWYVNTSDMDMKLISNTISEQKKQELKEYVRSGSFYDVINGYVDNLVVKEDRDRIRNELSMENLMVNVKEGSIYHMNYKVDHGDGIVHHREGCVARVTDDTGVIHFAIGIRNIDSIIEKELEKQKELEEAKEAAEAANRAKSNFLFNMSHDIRTPLNAIIGFTDLALKKIDDPAKVNEYLKNIHMSGEKLLDILNGVLEMARIESNKVTISEDLVNARDFFNSCYVMFDEAFRKKYLFCKVDYDIVHPYMYVDKTHVEEVFLNIISNAVKYTPDGGVIEIKITEKRGRTPEECIVETVIADNGIGMSEEFLVHAFDDFARERTEKTTNITGTGLGLPIVKRLVDLMHGTITIESKLGKGTKVTITLPHKIGTETGLINEKTTEIDPKVFRGKTILLAEDNDLNAEIALEILRDAGFNVLRVSDGIECVRSLSDNKAGTFDLILMDIQMPNMDGYRATHEIRNIKDKKKSGIPIIAMTANAFKEDEQRAIAEGMNGHIAKPIDINNLFETLATIVSNT